MTMLCSTVFAKETLKIIVPQPPGGLNDSFVRQVQKIINENEELNLNVLVINKPGGDGVVAINETINERADYVLLFSGLGVFYKSLELEENHKKAKSLTPIAQMLITPTVFVVDKNSNFKSWQQLTQYAKSNNVNIGTNSLISKIVIDELFTNTKVNPIPFNGDAQVLLNLKNKTLDVGTLNYFIALPHINSGELIALSMTHENTQNIFHANSNTGNIPVGFSAPPSMTPEKNKKMFLILSNILKSKELQNTFANRGIFLVKTPSQENYKKIIDDIMNK